MTLLRRASFAGILFLVGLGCGRSKDDIPIRSLNIMTVDAICETQVRCGQYADRGTCGQVWVSSLQIEADVNAGIVQYDGHAAANCLDAYASMGCNLSDQDNLAVELAACNDVFKGTIADGGACLDDAECVSLTCNRAACGDDACCAGTCQAKVRVGGDCSAPGSVCADEAVCTRFASVAPAVCMPVTPAGHACHGTEICASGKTCNLDPTTGVGTCGDLPATGAPCPAGRCDSRNDFCDPATVTCAPRAALGGACSSASACVGFAKCDPSTLTCVARMAAGGACATSGDCITGLSCAAGVCAPPAGAPACPSAS